MTKILPIRNWIKQFGKEFGFILFLLLFLVGLVSVGSQSFGVNEVKVSWIEGTDQVLWEEETLAAVKSKLTRHWHAKSLFFIAISPVQMEVLSGWPEVSAVRVRRILPHTLEVCLEPRVPLALAMDIRSAHSKGGELRLRGVDATGALFDRSKFPEGIPVITLSGVQAQQQQEVFRTAVRLINQVSTLAQEQATDFRLAGLDISPARGYRILLIATSASGRPYRTWVDLGSAPETLLDGKTHLKEHLSALVDVFKYLKKYGLETRQIWAELDKKIVVKKWTGS
jgi:hypothetical protein